MQYTIPFFDTYSLLLFLKWIMQFSKRFLLSTLCILSSRRINRCDRIGTQNEHSSWQRDCLGAGFIMYPSRSYEVEEKKGIVWKLLLAAPNGHSVSGTFQCAARRNILWFFLQGVSNKTVQVKPESQTINEVVKEWEQWKSGKNGNRGIKNNTTETATNGN